MAPPSPGASRSTPLKHQRFRRQNFEAAAGADEACKPLRDAQAEADRKRILQESAADRRRLRMQLGKLRQTDQIGGVCVDVLTLKQVTKKELVATSVGAKTNHSGCNPAKTTVHLKPVGDDLQYRSESEESGRPEARMSKVG